MRRFHSRQACSGRGLLDIEELECRTQPSASPFGAWAAAVEVGAGDGTPPVPPGWLNASPAAVAIEAAWHSFGRTPDATPGPSWAVTPEPTESSFELTVWLRPATTVLIFEAVAPVDPPAPTLDLDEPADLPATNPPATTVPSATPLPVNTDAPRPGQNSTSDGPTFGPSTPGTGNTETGNTAPAGGITTSPALTRSGGREEAARGSDSEELAASEVVAARLVTVATPIVLVAPDATATPGRPAVVVPLAAADQLAEVPGTRDTRVTEPLPRFTPTVVDYITGSTEDDARSPRAAEPGADGALPKDGPPVEVAPPPHEPGKSEAPAAPAEAVPGAADAAAPDAGGVVAELFAVILPEELSTRWTWLAAAAGITAAGYWAVRRYWRKLARKVLARKLPAPLGTVTAVETA